MKDLLKKAIKAPMFLIFSIILVLSAISACVLYINAEEASANTYSVTLPEIYEAIDTLQYSIGTIKKDTKEETDTKETTTWTKPQSANSSQKLVISNGQKIRLAVKFNESYSGQPLNNISIKSTAQGESNSEYKLEDDKEINSENTYISEEIEINQDQTLYFDDICTNKYPVILNIPKANVNTSSKEIFDIYYSTTAPQKEITTTGMQDAIGLSSFVTEVPSELKKIYPTSSSDSKNTQYNLADVPYGTQINLEIKLKSEYSQLSLEDNFNLYCKNLDTKIQKDGDTYKITETIKEETIINLRFSSEEKTDTPTPIDVTPNKYKITNETGTKLYYKNKTDTGEFQTLNAGATLNDVGHGETYIFYTDFNTELVYDDTKLMDKTTTENGKTAYILPNITGDHTIDELHDESPSGTYFVQFPDIERIQFINPSDGKSLSEKEYVKADSTFKFKIKESEGYSADNLEIKYKTSNSEVPTTLYPTDGTYIIEKISGNIEIVVSGSPDIKKFKIKIPRNPRHNLSMTVENDLGNDNKKELRSETENDEENFYDIYEATYGEKINIKFERNEEMTKLNLINLKIFNEYETPTITRDSFSEKTSNWSVRVSGNILVKIEDLNPDNIIFTFNNNKGGSQISFGEEKDGNITGSYYEIGDKKVPITKYDISKNQFSVPYKSDVYLKITSTDLDNLEIHKSVNKNLIGDIITPTEGYYVIKGVTNDIFLEERKILSKQFTISLHSYEKNDETSSLSSVKISKDGNSYRTYSDLSEDERENFATVPFGQSFKLYLDITKSDTINVVKNSDSDLNKIESPTVDDYVSLREDDYDKNNDYCGNFGDDGKTFKVQNEGTDKNPKYFIEIPEVNSDDILILYDVREYKTHKVTARNMASKYTLVGASEEGEDYKISFQESPTDMEESLGIKVPGGSKEYNMAYHVIKYVNPGNEQNLNAFVKPQNSENLAGGDGVVRYEAPKKLKINLEYGKNCTKKNFIGFQFDGVRYDKVPGENGEYGDAGGTQIRFDDEEQETDMFGLRKQFINKNESEDQNDPYSYMYTNTKADKGRAPTDSLRGLFQIPYVIDTTFIAEYLKTNSPSSHYGHYSIFNTKYFSYDYSKDHTIQFYSLIMKINSLNYITRDRKAYNYELPSPHTSSGSGYTLLYKEKPCPDETGGNVTVRDYYRKDNSKLNELTNEELEENGYFRDENNDIYIKGKDPEEITLKDGTKKSNIDLDIEAKSLNVYTDRPSVRYEDDILLKGDNITAERSDAVPQNVRTYSHKDMGYNYENRCVTNRRSDRVSKNNPSTMMNFSTKSRTYGDEYGGNSSKIFNIRAMNFFKEIRIKPIFSNVTYTDDDGNYSETPTVKLPRYPTTGAKFYKPGDEENPLGNEITTETMRYSDQDPCWSKDSTGKYWNFNFIIKPEEEYNFVPGSVKCYPEGSATLSYEKKTDNNSETYYVYTIQKIKKDNITITVPEIQKYKYTISCNNGYTDFYDNSSGEQFLKKDLEIGSSLTFRTEQQKGYQSDETLIINVGNDTFKVTSDGSTPTAVLPNGTIISFLEKTSTMKNLYTISNIQENFSIFSTRLRENIPVTLTYDKGFYYKDVDGKYITMKKAESGQEEVYYTDDPSEISEKNIELEVDYGSNFYFTIEERDGFDPLSTILTANNIRLDQENGKYLVKNITSETIVKAESIEKIKYNVYFTNHEGVTFKSSDGKDVIGENTVTYGDDLIFKLNISDAYSNSENYKVMVEYSTEGKKSTEIPKIKNDDGNDTDKYIIKNIQEDLRVYVENLEHNKYNMKLYNSDGIMYYDKYGQEKYSSGGQFVEKTIYHGENFSFKIVAEEGYDISEIKVYSTQEKTNIRKQLLPSNDVYTIEQPTNNCTITVENTKKSTYNVEIRSTAGARCLDVNGNTLESNLTVNHGENLEFTIALDNAYNHSTPIVTLKGSLNTITPVDGKYIVANITENKIVEITGVKKNTYKATFKETEGVIYKNGKNKPFSGYLDAEDGETLNFKITLMDAYDKSTPIVLLNNSKPIAESAGVYSINDVNSDLEISVENVFKNPEEVTMEDVNNVPDKVSTELDISRVVTATNTYLGLSDEEKAQVTNLADLKRAQQEAGVINHKAGDISVTGLDWNIKVMVEKLSGNKEKIKYLNEKIDRREVIYLYDIYLVDLLTNEIYELPYGNKVTVSMPAPELYGYKNETVVHEKSSGNIEYLDLNITDGTARFDATSFSLFGIAAKKIPNYSENPSATKISVSDIVDNEEELQALLGEGVTSQLGDLTKDVSGTDIFGDDLSSSSKKEIKSWYQWILDHELLSVIIIMIIGSLLIFLILLKAKKENHKSNN